MANTPLTFGKSGGTFAFGFGGNGQFKTDFFAENPAKFETGFGDNGGTGFDSDFGEVKLVPATEVYEGPYEITPEVVAQEVPTAEKYLKKNMMVKAIPFYDVGNAAGGRTIYIGEELE